MPLDFGSYFYSSFFSYFSLYHFVFINIFCSILEARKFADINHLHMKIKDNESILSKYRAMKKSIAKMQFLIAKICNFIEKLKNLLTWSDPQKTFYFFIVIFILYVFVSRILIRALILIGILDKFFTGKRFYSRVYDRNAKLSALVLKYIVNKNFPDLMKILDQDIEWPQNILQNAIHKKV